MDVWTGLTSGLLLYLALSVVKGNVPAASPDVSFKFLSFIHFFFLSFFLWVVDIHSLVDGPNSFFVLIRFNVGKAVQVMFLI